MPLFPLFMVMAVVMVVLKVIAKVVAAITLTFVFVSLLWFGFLVLLAGAGAIAAMIVHRRHRRAALTANAPPANESAGRRSANDTEDDW